VTEIDRHRHARHLLLSEIGEQGQARLCATRVVFPESADPSAGAVARDYLTRAGLHVAPVGIIAPVPCAAAIRTLAGRPELEPAAAALAGAFAAVEAIKAALDLPRSELPADLSLGGESSP
jgi:hypothetical protein